MSKVSQIKNLGSSPAGPPSASPKPRKRRRTLLLGVALATAAPLAFAVASLEIYSGLDPDPESAPLLEGGPYQHAPEAMLIPPPSASDPAPTAPKTASQEKPPRTNSIKKTARQAPAPTPKATAQSKPKQKEEPENQLREQQEEIRRLRKEIAQLKDELNQAKAMERTFAQVPRKHAPSIARRLSIVARLLLRHGRAYDYRSHTTQELQALLSTLEKAKR